MEKLGGQSDLITKMSNFYWILNFYDYAYDSVKILRSLCQETRYLWMDQQNAISNMFKKQTIHIKDEPIDRHTITMLKRGNRYKMYKLDITLFNTHQDRLSLFYRILEEMPEFEISKIKILGNNNNLIETLVQKSYFKTKQDLFKVIESKDDSVAQQSEPHEYLSHVYNPEHHDMR